MSQSSSQSRLLAQSWLQFSPAVTSVRLSIPSSPASLPQVLQQTHSPLHPLLHHLLPLSQAIKHLGPSHPFRKLIGWHLPSHFPRLRLSRFRRFTRFLFPCVTNRSSLLPESYHYIFYFVGTKRLLCIGVVVGFGLALVQSTSAIYWFFALV